MSLSYIKLIVAYAHGCNIAALITHLSLWITSKGSAFPPQGLGGDLRSPNALKFIFLTTLLPINLARANEVIG